MRPLKAAFVYIGRRDLTPEEDVAILFRRDEKAM